MTITILMLAVACVLLVFILMKEGKKNTTLLSKNDQLKGRVDAMQEVVDKAVSSQQGFVQENAEVLQKPFTIESVRTALRFNGFSPEVPESNDGKSVAFKVDDLRFRVVTESLPAVSIELGFNYSEPENDALLRQAASDLTAHMYIVKTVILGEGKIVVFSAEFLCDSYTYFRDNLKEYIDGILRARNHFREAYDALLERQKQEKEAVFSGNSFIQDPSAHPIIQS